MTEDQNPAGMAGDEDIVNEEGQVETQTAEAEEPEGEKPEGDRAEDTKPERETAKERRDRDKAYKAELRRNAEEAKTSAERAEAQYARIKEAGKSGKPPVEADFADYADYVAAKSVYQYRQQDNDAKASDFDSEAKEHRKRQEAITAAEQQLVDMTWTAQRNAARAKYTDLDTVIDGVGPMVSQDMASIIKTSDHGVEIAYHLGKNKDLALQIAKLPPLEAAREMGRLEARLTPPKAKTQSSAPDPINPVKATGSGPKDPTAMNPDQYRAWRQGGGKITR